MVVTFKVDFGPNNSERLIGMAATLVELDELPEGWDYDALDGHLVGYLKRCGLSHRYLRTEAVITGEVGSGSIYAGDKWLGTFTLRQLEPAP